MRGGNCGCSTQIGPNLDERRHVKESLLETGGIGIFDITLKW